MDTALFVGWRSEIEAELLEAQTQLADAHLALHEACAACEVAEARQQDLHDAVARLTQPVSHALAARVHVAGQDVRPAQGRAAQARGQIVASRQRIQDLEQALREIDRLNPPPALVAVEEEIANAV